MTSRMTLQRSGAALVDRLLWAAGVATVPVIAWAGMWAVSLLTWSSGPQLDDLLVLIVPFGLLAVWITAMALARGHLEIGADDLIVRHRRVLRRPLSISRADVRSVALDEGWSGNARFPTTDPSAPFLWSDRRPRHQDRHRPLLGDAKRPNLAVVLRRPRVISEARGPLTAMPTAHDLNPPSRRVAAEIVFLAVEDPAAARSALATWPVDDAIERAPLPPLVREPGRPAPEILVAIVAMTLLSPVLVVMHLAWLFPVALIALIPLVARGVRHNLDRAERALELAGDDPYARAAVHANHNPALARSQPPPVR